ncbi:MAG: hypothetical protein IJI98_05510, partial [Methanosphaera sp.]|nr:hypothetical protein [Methanosphaera sp.]
MLKKTILIILVVMFLTGCSVDYKVDINNIDKIVETIEFNSESNNDINSIESFEYAIPIDKNSDETVNYNSVKGNDAFYNLVKNENNTKMTLNHTFDIYKYKNIFLPVLCYDYFEAIKDEDFVILSTSNKFKCFESYPELSAVNVIVTSKYKTTENNA